FSQYFLNDSAETAAFVTDALETIGAPKTADICRRAIESAYPNGLPPTPEGISSLAAELQRTLSHDWRHSTPSSSGIRTTSRSCCTHTLLATLKNLEPCRTRARTNTVLKDASFVE